MPKKTIALATVIIFIVVAAVFLSLQAPKTTVVDNKPLPSPNTNTGTSTNLNPVIFDNISSGAVVSSPLVVTGKALGTWFFEANLPIKIKDANGALLGQTGAQAEGEWMTTDYVPFTASLVFVQSPTPTGTLVIEKDNPSGLPENDASVSIPVVFATSTKNQISVDLYYYNSVKANELGDACSLDAVLPVERTIAKSSAPIKDTINLLISGALSTAEKNQGFSTEFTAEKLTLVGANLRSGVLTLEFSDPNNFTSGGSCRVGLLAEQIVKTAEQFAGVDSVVLKPSELFQP